MVGTSPGTWPFKMGINGSSKLTPSGNLEVCYRKKIAIYSWYNHQQWWCSTVSMFFGMFTREVPLNSTTPMTRQKTEDLSSPAEVQLRLGGPKLAGRAALVAGPGSLEGEWRDAMAPMLAGKSPWGKFSGKSPRGNPHGKSVYFMEIHKA